MGLAAGSQSGPLEGRDITFTPWADRPPQAFEVRSDLNLAPDELRGGSARGPWIVPTGKAQDMGTRVARTPADTKHLLLSRHAGLHEIFAAAPLDERSIVGLANQFGLLGTGLRLVGPGGVDDGVVVGESVGYWRETISMLQALLEMWEDLDDKTGNWLRSYVWWSDEPRRHVEISFASINGRLVNSRGWSFSFKSPDNDTSEDRWSAITMPDGLDYGDDRTVRELWLKLLLESARRQPDIYDVRMIRHTISADELESQAASLRDGDVHQPIAYFVTKLVNEQLRGKLSPQVSPKRRGGLTLVPHTLKAWLYALFALDLSRDSQALVRCLQEDCGKEFRPIRRSQKYCSTACRSKAYYWGKKAEQG